MGLQDKYASIINSATEAGVENLTVQEKDGVLHIEGRAPSAAIKDQLWDAYETIDPNFSDGDLVMKIDAPERTEYQIKPGDTLSKIGKKFNKPWRDIYEANRDVIGDNPDYIQAGWKIKV